MPRHESPIPPDPRWWHHVLWWIGTPGCSHAGVQADRSSTLIVLTSGYSIESFQGMCAWCARPVRWSKRHEPIWLVRVIRKVRLPWAP